MITAKILADSRNPAGSRLTSFLLTYPRFIHSEFLTHRVFSRNAASSRAIPFTKMLDAISDSGAAYPEFYSLEHKGMQAISEVEDRRTMKQWWEESRNRVIQCAWEMHKGGLAKSLCNRLIEPWSHITVLATATDLGLANFFALRAHPAAMPEFQVLAYRMLALYLQGTPRELPWGFWHAPHFEGAPEFVDSEERSLKIATARCARLSYLTFDNEIDPEKDIELHDRLAASGHWSPFEHCAQAVSPRGQPYPRSNYDIGEDLCGWMQYRKQFDNENQTKVSLTDIMATKPDWITL